MLAIHITSIVLLTMITQFGGFAYFLVFAAGPYLAFNPKPARSI